MPWRTLPLEVRGAVADMLGSPVIAAQTRTGGFSRGVAARLCCADGRRAFVKAVPVAGDPYAVDLYRREAQIAALLPTNLPAPAFLGPVDRDGWLALLFDDARGATPIVPWQRPDLDAVLATLVELTGQTTPCPVPHAPPWGGGGTDWQGWKHLLDSGAPLTGLPAWVRRRAPRLAALEADVASAAAGDTLLHSDLRSDNIILGEERVFLVDWAWAARGRDWLDPLIFALCAAVQGHPDPEAVLRAHPSGRAAEPEAVDSVLAALAGRFAVAAQAPADHATAPIRAFQRAECDTALRWLAARTRLDRSA